MAEAVTVTAQEVALLSKWFAEQGATLPGDVRGVMERVLRVLAVLDTLVRRHKTVLKMFRQALGITPKSERGAALTKQ